MKAKQVIFKDMNGAPLAGIMLDDSRIICGCCGRVLNINDGEAFLVQELNWIPIAAEIGGDVLFDLRQKSGYSNN